MLTPHVERAILEIRTALPENPVAVHEDGDGGARVIVEGMQLGGPYSQESTWIGFHITFPYPSADVYPHFVRNDLARKDQRALGEGFSPGQKFLERPAVQVSRRSNRLDPRTDTALHKLLKVMHWLENRP